MPGREEEGAEPSGARGRGGWECRPIGRAGQPSIWPLLLIIALLIQGGIVSQCARIAPESERLNPELFSREDSLPPCFRLLSTERRSEWKPSPNMTSKLLLTMS